MACTICTRLPGRSRSVSRVAGAAPRTSTPAVAPASARITVQPVGRCASVKWPTLMPGTAVSVLLALAGVCASSEALHAASVASRSTVNAWLESPLRSPRI